MDSKFTECPHKILCPPGSRQSISIWQWWPSFHSMVMQHQTILTQNASLWIMHLSYPFSSSWIFNEHLVTAYTGLRYNEIMGKDDWEYFCPYRIYVTHIPNTSAFLHGLILSWSNIFLLESHIETVNLSM